MRSEVTDVQRLACAPIDQRRFFDGIQNLDRKPHLARNRVHEVVAVARFADRAGGDGDRVVRREALGHLAQL